MNMTIEQTIEVPENHRIFLEIPEIIPQGMAKISLHIVPLKTTPLPQTSQESKCAAFQAFIKRRKAAPPGFDYKKELLEALDEKHGRIG
jgi:hypothetical protein